MNLLVRKPKIHQPKPISLARPRFSIQLADGRNLSLGTRTLIMGILNVTPDSFSQDGCLKTHKNPIRIAQKMIRDGAGCIDIGGESSRPFAKPVPLREELKRVLPVIELLKTKINVPISIDTQKPAVAKAAMEAGADIINYIKGTQPDPKMLQIVAKYTAPVILMHMAGTPLTMQKNPQYSAIISEIYAYFKKSMEICLDFGIKSDKLIMDPGIGFGKSLEHNLQILNHLKDFQPLKMPVLIGTSRKSFIGTLLNKETKHRLNGSIASICAAVMNGAQIVRVHDVKETHDAMTIIDAILNESTL